MNRAKLIFVYLHLLLFILSCDRKNTDLLDSFVIHPDFNLDLVASEPLVFDPVEMKFDENGDAFVLEMPGYPLGDAESRLVMLKDEDEDGIYDKRLVYANDLGVATSFEPYLEGFLVASPPKLLWLIDTNKDGIADERKIIMDGFSNDNLQHNFNGLAYGLDNWIYAANGGNSGKPYFITKPENVLDLRNGDLRINLETQQLARVGQSSGGFKISFDQWGHLFETHNTKHISQLVFEDRYTENLPGNPSNALVNISNHEENGSSRIYPIGEQVTRLNHPEQSGYISGSSGITFYNGGIFPKQFDSCIFVADCVLNLIHVDILSKNGTSFEASRLQDKLEFLASKDRSFRPVNMAVGPDGALYVIDMHREVIEHPEWIPDELEVSMDLDSGKEKGRIYRITPKNYSTPPTKILSVKDPKSLVASLKGKTQWERITVQRLLVTNKLKDATPYLIAQLKNSENPLARLHSLWTLEGLNELTISLLMEGLTDESSNIRENAIKIAETKLNKNTSLIDTILELTKDEDANVSMQAALTLGTLNDKNYQDYKEEILKALTDQLAKNENDIWSIRAIASGLQRQPVTFIQTQLVNSNNIANSNFQVVEILAELVGNKLNHHQTAFLIGEINKNELDLGYATHILDALSRGWQRGTHSKSDPNGAQEMELALEFIEKEGNTSSINASGKLRQASGLTPSSKIGSLLRKAAASVLNGDNTAKQRLADLQLIGLDEFDKREQLLYQMLDSKMPLVLQKEALIQLQNSNKHTIAPKLLEHWKTLGPEARKEATDILLYKSYNHDLLLSAMENGQVNLGEFNLDLERRRVLLFSKDDALRKRAEALFSDAGVVQRKEAIENMRPALTLKGNAVMGRDVFSRVCASCHMYDKLGVEVGPTLTEIHRKSKETLLYDILDPNAAVNTAYLNHKLTTNNGNIFTGLIYRETDNEIGLRMNGGVTKTIKKVDIESLESLGTSYMLEGLEESMNQQEMADLLTFLQSPKL